MAAAEVSYERVGVFERQTLMNMLATAVNESARNQAANEAIIGRIREVEGELADNDRIRQQLTEAHTGVQRDYEACIRERDELTEKLGAAKDQFTKSYEAQQEHLRTVLLEGTRLANLVHKLGGDPNPPIDDAGEPDEEPTPDTDQDDQGKNAGD